MNLFDWMELVSEAITVAVLLGIFTLMLIEKKR